MLSGYVTYSESIKPWIELYQGVLQTCSDFDLINGVADSRITSHIQKAVMRGVRWDIVHSSDTDVEFFFNTTYITS